MSNECQFAPLVDLLIIIAYKIRCHLVTGQTFQCVPPNLIPYGEGYSGASAGCAVTGAGVGVSQGALTTFIP